jgi:NAD(P)-dependent dehydrogenase (short-subunit alcohol dehydrogenase family)
MSLIDTAGVTAVVTGASRGFGRAIAANLAAAGTKVVGIARSEPELKEVKAQLGDGFTFEVADVAGPGLPADLFARYEPRFVVLNAGATPLEGELDRQTWETFSTNWNVDVRQTFNFCTQALRAPLPPGSVVVSLSSGAALRGSPLSGGYAGAKASVRFVSAYAAAEASRRDLGIRFVALLPQLTPATALGAAYVRAYGNRAGMTEEEYLSQFGSPPLTTEQVGDAVLALITDSSLTAPAYLVNSSGLKPVD